MRTDSDSENDMAAEEKRSHAGHGRTLLKRVFSAKKTSWLGWWYDMRPQACLRQLAWSST